MTITCIFLANPQQFSNDRTTECSLVKGEPSLQDCQKLYLWQNVKPDPEAVYHMTKYPGIVIQDLHVAVMPSAITNQYYYLNTAEGTFSKPTNDKTKAIAEANALTSEGNVAILMTNKVYEVTVWGDLNSRSGCYAICGTSYIDDNAFCHEHCDTLFA